MGSKSSFDFNHNLFSLLLLSSFLVFRRCHPRVLELSNANDGLKFALNSQMQRN